MNIWFFSKYYGYYYFKYFEARSTAQLFFVNCRFWKPENFGKQRKYDDYYYIMTLFKFLRGILRYSAREGECTCHFFPCTPHVRHNQGQATQRIRSRFSAIDLLLVETSHTWYLKQLNDEKCVGIFVQFMRKHLMFWFRPTMVMVWWNCS